MSTTTVPLTSGGPRVAVQVAGNTPAGYALLNTDAAASITLTAGATGPTIATLDPGGQLVWRDPAVFPYAAATGAAGTAPVVLVVTDQAGDYSNPAAVAAVTAAKLAAQGIPSTLLDTAFPAFSGAALPAVADNWNMSSYTPPTANVGACSSLLVSVSWPQQSPRGCGRLQLNFTDAAASGQLGTWVGQVLTLTADNRKAGVATYQYAWRLPVLAPNLTVVNLQAPDGANAPAWVTVLGSNRPAGALRQLGDDTGVRTVSVTGTFAVGTIYYLSSGPQLGETRLNGPCKVNVTAPQSGTVYASYVDGFGTAQLIPFGVGNGITVIDWNHPPLPVAWGYAPGAPNTNTVTITVVGCPT